MDMTETKPALSSVSADDARDRGGKAQPMLIARGLQKHFPITGGILNRTVARIRAVDQGELYRHERRDAGCGGQIRLWQINPRPAVDASDPAGQRRIDF